MLNVIMLNVVMLSVIMLSVVMLTVVAPLLNNTLAYHSTPKRVLQQERRPGFKSALGKMLSDQKS
jgi:hypothetical protein